VKDRGSVLALPEIKAKIARETQKNSKIPC
jgi:hypothetical protein